MGNNKHFFNCEHWLRMCDLTLLRQTKKQIKMNNEKNIKVEMYNVVENDSPFVKVDYMDCEGQKHTGLMLLDSGSDNNFLSAEMADHIDVLNRMADDVISVVTTTGKVKASGIRFSFAFGGVQFHEKFFISECGLPQDDDELPLIGILGNYFMQEHELVIDFSDDTIHTSYVVPENFKIEDCDFFFPMDIGLDNYIFPILSLGQRNLEVVAVADTGANANMISLPTLKSGGFRSKYVNRKVLVTGYSGKVETRVAIMDYNLLSLIDPKGNTKEVEHCDDFLVMPGYIWDIQKDLVDQSKGPLEPVEAIVGASFMRREHWILDFAIRVIYKCKECETLREVV